MSTIPDFKMLIRLAFAEFQAKRMPEAQALCERILAQEPRHAGALQMLGMIAFTRRDFSAAIERLRQSLALAPGVAEFHNNLGEALLGAGRVLEAIERYRAAIALKPSDPQAYNNLGNALRASDKVEAVRMYRTAIDLNPSMSKPHYNLGDLAREEGRLDEAEAHLRRALELEPRYIKALQTLGVVLSEKRQFDRAMEVYDRALQFDPGAADVGLNRALLMLLLGRMPQGWAEYEWRLKCSEFAGHVFARPRWDGSPLHGRTVLLHREQGYGDLLQFVRYAPMVAARGGRVVLLCQPEMKGLLRTVPGVSAVATDVAEAGAYDVQVPLMSLPYIFGTTLESIPATVPYLSADPERARVWREKSAAAEAGGDGKLRVGLVWSGGPVPPGRSCGLEALTPLARIARVGFYSLQKGESAERIASAPAGMKLVDWSAGLHDFAETAAAIVALDLLISVDTAAAHLAGALGRPVWTLLKYNADCRWLLDRSDSPWYPTMRLFRQTSEGDWGGVVERVKQALEERVAGAV